MSSLCIIQKLDIYKIIIYYITLIFFNPERKECATALLPVAREVKRNARMRKVLVDFLLLLVFLGTPLALILALPEDGSISILPILPILLLGGVAFVRTCVVERLFFEIWIEKWPLVAKPLLVFAIFGVIYCEMGIVLHYKLPVLNIPTHSEAPRDELEQALADEFPEFH